MLPLGKRIKQAVVHIFGGVVLDDRNPQPMGDPLDDNYLFDFTPQFRSNWVGGGTITVGSNGEAVAAVPTKIVVKPIDVLNELETVPTPFGVESIDEKIAILKDKEALIKQHYAKREVQAMIERLENRKKYAEHKKFFDQFQNTTDEKIQALLEKYALELHPSDIFIPEFPDVAVKLMKSYSKKVKEITGKEAAFYVIAQPEMFKKAYEKRDPILLAQSPFGFYYQILGAWDKELIMLSEL